MASTTKKARNGFFFAVMALAMLSLVLMTVQTWVKTFEQSDYRASQRFKGEAMRAVLSSLSDKTLTDFANASAFYATYRLVNYTSDADNGGLGTAVPSNDPDNLNTGMVNRTIFELMLNGTSEPNAHRQMAYSLEENSSYTINGWQKKIDAAANAMGFDIRFSDVKNFDYRQVDAWTVGVSFDLEMSIEDMDGTMRQNKAVHAQSSFPISGFLDPMITRNDMARAGQRDLAAEKQIFRHDLYNVPADVKPAMVKDMAPPGEGNGWFFGPIVESYPETLPDTGAGATTANIKQYVLVHPYDASLSAHADSYGAVIITEEPMIEAYVDENGCNAVRQTRCLNCMQRTEENLGAGCVDNGWEIFSNEVHVPVIAVTNWNTNDVTEVKTAQTGGDNIINRYVLIDNTYESRNDKMKADAYHRVWDITLLRDMAICGFYVKGAGPSFFQRMLAGAETNQNPQLGIESFVVGQWAGGASGAPSYSADAYSRLDWEFYQSKNTAGNPTDAQKIKGMMGCKSKEMCIDSNPNATEIGVGKFRLSDDAAARYGSEFISCKETTANPNAPCD